MSISYLDLSVKDSKLKEELLAAVDRVLTHGRIVAGPEVEEFEDHIARFCGTRYAVGVGSGTTALYLSLKCLEVQPGDEVITTPLTSIATLNAISEHGAKPVFVDIRDDLNIDPNLVERAITAKTKVIVPVHFSGKLCDIDTILSIADRHSIDVVEDAAQAFGASHNGRMAGSFGRLGSFSMNPMKVYGAYGEAGAIVTNEEPLYRKLQTLRYHGLLKEDVCRMSALNNRLDTLQAALLLVMLRTLPDRIDRRREIARAYSNAFKNNIRAYEVTGDELEHTFYTYTLFPEQRDLLKSYLSSQEVETKIHHSLLVHQHPAYVHLSGFRLPVAEHMVKHILSIPNHEYLTGDEVKLVTEKVLSFHGDKVYSF